MGWTTRSRRRIRLVLEYPIRILYLGTLDSIRENTTPCWPSRWANTTGDFDHGSSGQTDLQSNGQASGCGGSEQPVQGN
ncbi:hypothetical protein U1Q18_013963 [Sarracenia purpurea var. burkii]